MHNFLAFRAGEVDNYINPYHMIASETLNISEGAVLSFEKEAELIELRNKVKELERIIGELRSENIKMGCYGAALRAIAQRYFSCDDHARLCASPDGKTLVSAVVAQKHWLEHGGPEAFNRDHPTPESVIHVFLVSHSVQRRYKKLGLPLSA